MLIKKNGRKLLEVYVIVDGDSFTGVYLSSYSSRCIY